MDLKSKTASHVVQIIRHLQDSGYDAFLVGGAVRDMLAGRKPKDYDISTSATPQEIVTLFGRRNARIIGKRFKIVHLRHGRDIIEISTFRKAPEVDEEGRILPFDNEFGTAYEDAWRRDFTVNAIFYDPLQDEIIDYTDMGLEDLEKGIVRIIGNPPERFEEDPVRILRALKLVGQYGFIMEKETETALKRALPLITHCPVSRLVLELEKVMLSFYTPEILKAFYEAGFLAYFLPFINEAWETEECRYMLDLLGERCSRAENSLHRNSISIAVATAALPFVESILRKESADGKRGWVFHPDTLKTVRDIIRGVMAPYNFPKRIIDSAVSMIVMQPSMLNKTRKDKIIVMRRYQHAKELMTLQNNIRYHDSSLNEFWPKHGVYRASKRNSGSGRVNRKRKGRRKNGPKGKQYN